MEDFLVAGFVTPFIHPQIPVPCLPFYSVFRTSLGHLSNLQFVSPAPNLSVPGHLRLPVTGDVTLEQKRGSNYKFVVLGFFKGISPMEGDCQRYQILQGGLWGHICSTCRDFSPERESGNDKLAVHSVLYPHVWEKARQVSFEGLFFDCGLYEWKEESPRWQRLGQIARMKSVASDMLHSQEVTDSNSGNHTKLRINSQANQCHIHGCWYAPFRYQSAKLVGADISQHVLVCLAEEERG